MSKAGSLRRSISKLQRELLKDNFEMTMEISVVRSTYQVLKEILKSEVWESVRG